MLLPQKISDEEMDLVQMAADKDEARAKKDVNGAWNKYQEDIEKQELFLKTFKKTFSVKQSRKMSQAEYYTYRRWLTRSIDFVQQWNAIIESAYSEIIPSALQGATGLLYKDDRTESGYQEDATGAPIYHDRDSSLTKAFLKGMYPDTFGDKVDMNLSGEVGIKEVQIKFIKPESEKPAEADE